MPGVKNCIRSSLSVAKPVCLVTSASAAPASQQQQTEKIQFSLKFSLGPGRLLATAAARVTSALDHSLGLSDNMLSCWTTLRLPSVFVFLHLVIWSFVPGQHPRISGPLPTAAADVGHDNVAPEISFVAARRHSIDASIFWKYFYECKPTMTELIHFKRCFYPTLSHTRGKYSAGLLICSLQFVVINNLKVSQVG